MKRVKRSALVSLVVGVCHVMAGCGDSEGVSGGGASGTTGTEATTGTADGPTTTTTTTTVSSSSTGGDGGGGGNPGDPCEPTDGEEIPVTCGIFVNGDAAKGGNGQQDTPYNNLTEAVAAAGGANNRIYVCGDLREPVTVPEGLEIHGEITCANAWRWDFDQRTLWEAFGDYTPLHFIGGTMPTVVTGFKIQPRDAVAAGQSSIAVIAEGGTLSLVRTDVIAGNGAPGQPGEAGAAGAAGTNGGAGSYGEGAAGAGGVSTCGGATGGTGAWESCIPALPPQQPVCLIEEATPEPGAGGSTFATSCTAGTDGMAGDAGSAGPDAVGVGSITADGFVTADGGPGTAGSVGGPGGGGGAKTDPNYWGGGGATGGCGSDGSTGGKGGGSSIAFISLNATILFEDVTASVSNGGNGGTGGSATPGGAGGAGGLGGCGALFGCPTARACRGGDGGVGGAGGPGGNGAGGHALIIAYTGNQNTLDGLMYDVPMPTQAGFSGGGTAPAGQSVHELEFP